MMGRLAFDENKNDEAIDYFKKTMLLAPEFEPVYYMLAVAQLKQKDPKKALETLGKAREKFKAKFAGEYYTSLAYSQLKDYTNVISHLTAAEIIARGTDETNRLDEYFYFQLGAAYERTQNFAEGEKNLKKCLALAPNSVEALNYLGYMYAEKGTNLTVAREMIEKALAKEPKNAAYLDSLGWVFYKMGNKKEALKYLLQAIENSQEPDATLFEHLGDTYHDLKQHDKARDAWRKALSLEASDALRKKLEATPIKDTSP
jgi:tetratricopeptide (TPR) repeat protein